MHTLPLFNSMAGLIVLVAAGTVLLARPTIHWSSPVGLSIRVPRHLRWHRRAGWMALGSLVLVGVVFPLASLYPATSREPRWLAHGVPCIVCAVAVLSRAWAIQRRMMRSRRQVVSWLIAVLTLGTCFFASTCALGTWRWGNAITVRDGSQVLIQRATILGHVGLGTALILLGRTALRAGAQATRDV